MGVSLNSNVLAQATRHVLAQTERLMTRASTRLSTGLRINSAADDAAGLAIASKMTTQVRSLAQAMRNANDGLSMLQAADASAEGLQNQLQRMRELSVQAMNDTYSANDRDALDQEFQGLQDEIGRTLSNAQWNGMALFDGTAGGGSLSFHIGPGADDAISVAFDDLSAGELGTPRSIADADAAGQALTSIDQAMNELNAARTRWGASMSRLTHAADAGNVISLNLAASRSRITDADYAQTTADLARSMIMRSAGHAMLSQANYQPRTVLALLR